MSRLLAWSLSAVFALGGGAAAAQDHHDHAGMVMPTPAKPTATRPSTPPLYTADDLAFLQHMIMHHQQAVDMGALMEGRAAHPELIRFAGLVADAQRAEIATMQGMLDLAAARGLTPPEHHMHGDPPMAGMLSQAEMKALAAAKGPEFERLWLQGMMFHHEGGLAMTRAQELRQALDGRQPFQLAGMVDDILVGQRAEIGIMQGWLTNWGLAEAGGRRAPALEVQSPPQGAAVGAGKALAVFGVAVGDSGIAGVQTAVHDMARDRWLRRDGTWGARETRPADLIGSGPASAAWRLDFTPPSAGRYTLEAEATDAAGKRSAPAGAWTVEALPRR
jgi:uncharacterized protein (DUF305 family)